MTAECLPRCLAQETEHEPSFVSSAVTATLLIDAFGDPTDVACSLRSAGYATDPVLVQIVWLATLCLQKKEKRGCHDRFASQTY